MKVLLLDILSPEKGYFNRDVMGGFGELTEVGNSFLAKLIEKKKKSGIKLPTFNLAYIAAILKKNGHEVEFADRYKDQDADLVIIHSSIVGYKEELKVAKKIKLNTNSAVTFIGPFSSFKPEIFKKYADFIILGEPEQVITQLKNKLPQGLVKSQPLKNLDELPFPLWEIFPLEEYSYSPIIKSKPFLPLLSSKGCVFSCEYCPYKAFYGKLRQRSVKSIIKEVQFVKDLGVEGVFFRDQIFTVNKRRATKIGDELLKRKIKIEWGCETHLDYLNKELIDKLYKSGLRAINVGIESYSDSILDNVKRKNNKKMRSYQEKVISYCNKKGIKVSAFYVLGLPQETRDDVLKTIRYAKKLNTFAAQFFISTPFPGTPLYDKVSKDIFEKDWEKFNSFTPVLNHEHLNKEELLKLKEKAFVEYYFRLKYVLKYWWSIIR